MFSAMVSWSVAPLLKNSATPVTQSAARNLVGSSAIPSNCRASLPLCFWSRFADPASSNSAILRMTRLGGCATGYLWFACAMIIAWHTGSEVSCAVASVLLAKEKEKVLMCYSLDPKSHEWITMIGILVN